MKSKLKYLVAFLLKNIMNPINNIIPKKNRIVLYSNLGFRDNVLSLYNFLIKEHINNKFEIIIISNHFYQSTKSELNVKKVGPFNGLYYFLTSRYFFYCFGKYPIKPSSAQVVVNLGHGMPIKKIGNSELKYKNINYNYFDFVLSYSDFFDSIIEESFSASSSQIIHTGAPRNDELFNNKKSNVRNIIWMPTYQEHRSGSLLDPFNTKNDIQKLDSFLKRKNCILYIKLHPLETDTVRISSTSSNIQLINDKEILSQFTSLYDFLAETWGLITDFSSVSIDYLLTDNPIAYILNDKDSFASERGFNFDSLSDVTAGPIIQDKSDFFDFIELVCGEIDDKFKLKRDVLKHTFYEYFDNHSSERLLKKVGIKK